MRIRILDKASGRTGTVPEEEFDPQKYTKIDDSGNIVHTPIVDAKPSTLGNIVGGPSDVLAQAAESKRKADEQSAAEGKLFQSVVVPAGQIIGGAVGGVAGAGAGGALGEKLRQVQAGEQQNLGNIVKEGAIGAGTQYVGGKIGEWLTKGKEAATAGEAVTKATEPNVLQKAGAALKEKASGINVNKGLKVKDVTRPIKAAEVKTLLKDYQLIDAGTEAPAKAAGLYQSALEDVKAAAAASTKKVNPTKVIATLNDNVVKRVGEEITKGDQRVLDLFIGKINGAKTVADLDLVDGEIRGLLAQVSPRSAKGQIYKTISDTIADTMKSKLPDYAGSFKTMADMRKVGPALGYAEDAILDGSLISIGRGGIRLEAPGIVRNAGVAAGSALEKLGGGLPSVSGMGLPPIAGSLVAPAMQAGAAALTTPPAPVEATGLAPIEQTPTTLPTETPQKQNFVTGYSPEKLYSAMQRAQAAGDKAAYSQLRQMYTDEKDYQKTQTTAGGKSKLTAGQKKEITDYQVSEQMLRDLVPAINEATRKGIIGPISGNLRKLNPYDADAQVFNSNMMDVAQNVGRAMEGGVLRAEDIPKYRAMLPNIGDTKEVALGKIKLVAENLALKVKIKEQMYGGSENLPDIGTTTDLTGSAEML